MGIKEIKMKEALEQELRSGGNRFLLVYSPWCPFCVEFLPIFEKLAAGNSAAFCKVSLDAMPDAEAEFSVAVTPTVLFFRNGELDRRLDGILDKGLTAESLAEFIWHCRDITK